MNFKPGDIVIGNEKANHYAVTKKDWVGKVLSVIDPDMIEVEGPNERGVNTFFAVVSERFDLYCDEIKEQDVLSML